MTALHPVSSGLERLLAGDLASVAGQKIGLLHHAASVDGNLRSIADLFRAVPEVDLRTLFGPQHGVCGQTQDNMIEWEGGEDPGTGLTTFSLYGDVRKPTAAMLEGVDTLVIDLQDVGARYYTYIWSMLLCLQACGEHGKRVVVLDRPNPLGGAYRQGNILEMEYSSFVGMAPIPIRHGLTIGELARYFVARFDIDVELEIIWMSGWSRHAWFDETGLPWVMPSPNMPTLETAIVYPGSCLLEGTELSEGRGTTRPFEIFGAPYIDPERLVARIDAWRLPGCVLRPLRFEPTFQKHAGVACGGAQVHVTDRRSFRPVMTFAAVLAAVHDLWPDSFRWREPPYEYEYETLPIDILAGGPQLRLDIEAGRSPLEMAARWGSGLAAFATEIREFQHYD